MIITYYNTELYAIITSLLIHDTIKLASPKFPKPIITFLIANMFTSAIKKTSSLKGFWGYRGILSDITKDTVFVRFCASTKIVLQHIHTCTKTSYL